MYTYLYRTRFMHMTTAAKKDFTHIQRAEKKGYYMKKKNTMQTHVPREKKFQVLV